MSGKIAAENYIKIYELKSLILVPLHFVFLIYNMWQDVVIYIKQIPFIILAPPKMENNILQI